MSELSRADLDRMLAGYVDDSIPTVCPLPWFDDEAERREWAGDFADDLVAASLIVDDPDERAAAVALVERSVPVRPLPDTLARYLVFGGVASGCLAVEVSIAGGGDADLAELAGKGQAGVTVAEFEGGGVRGVESFSLGSVPIGRDGVIEQAVGEARTVVRRDVPDLGPVAVQVIALSVDIVLLVSAKAALRGIAADPGLPGLLGDAVAFVTSWGDADTH